MVATVLPPRPEWAGGGRGRMPASSEEGEQQLRRMPNRFAVLPEHRLDALDDDALLDYLLAARAAGAEAAATAALQRLVFANIGVVRARVRLKVPAALVEDLACDAMVEALQAAFDGTSMGQFNAWLGVIVRRTIADFWRGPAGRQLERDREAAAAAGGGRDGDPRDTGPGGEPQVVDHGTVEVQDLIDRLRDALSPAHRRIVDSYVFDDVPAGEVAAQTGETAANVYQVARRFREALREGLADGPQGGGRAGAGGSGDTGGRA